MTKDEDIKKDEDEEEKVVSPELLEHLIRLIKEE